MPAVRRQTIGRVASLYVGSVKRAPSTSVNSFMLTFTGIVADVHSGATRAAGPREPAFRRGTMLANLRQVSLVSVEELEMIASRMGLARLDPAWLAANIAIEGAGPITQLPRGTIIRFPSGASLYVSDLNSPCKAAARTSSANMLARHNNKPLPLSPTHWGAGALSRSFIHKDRSAQATQLSFCSRNPSLPIHSRLGSAPSRNRRRKARAFLMA